MKFLQYFVLVSLIAAGSAQAETFDVTVGNFSFSPKQLTIQVGDTVRWTNQQGNHNVKANDGSFRCANGCDGDGDGGDGTASNANWTVSITFTEEDIIDYHCEPHLSFDMTGRIFVEAGQEPDPENGEIVITQTPLTVDEGNGQVNVALSRLNGSDGMVSVDFSTVNGSASSGEDYEAASGIVSWADGDSADKQIAVSVIDDSDFEDSETFDFTLSSPSGGATLGSPDTAQIIIVDNDPDPNACLPNETTLCLQENDRFQVQVTFDAGDGPTSGQVIDFAPRDSGVFYFFSPDNAEILVKVINACVPLFDNKYWVFFAATTDVKFDLTVTDTEAGESKTYSNPAGMDALPVTDTDAFSTCP